MVVDNIKIKESDVCGMVNMLEEKTPVKCEDMYYSFTHNDPAMCLTLIKGVIDAGGNIDRIAYEKWDNKEFTIFYKVKK